MSKIKVKLDSDQAGTSEQPDGPRKEIRISETGQYSRVMEPDEYREWVRQTVSGQIWGRMTAIFSAVGFAAIVAMFTYMASVSNTTIEGKIATETKKLNEEIDKKLPNVVNLELSNQIRTNRLIPSISENAVKQITANKGVETALQNLIIAQSQKLLLDQPSQSSLKAVALQQILLFGDQAQKTDAITGVIFDEHSGEQEFSLAMQNYLSNQPNSSTDKRRLLYVILGRVALRDANFSADSWRALEQIIKQDNVLDACNWIKDAMGQLDNKYGTEALKKIVERVADAGGYVAGGQFATWLESNDPLQRDFGEQGLMAISGIEETAGRQTLAARIAKILAVTTRLPHDEYLDHIAQLTSAIRLRDISALRRTASSPIATPRIKELVSQVGSDFDDRQLWFYFRNVNSAQDVERIGHYGPYERNTSAYHLLGSLLDASPNSSDWDKLIAPKIAEAGGKWTAPGQANLLVNAWVSLLQKSALSNPSSLAAAANLFVDANLSSDLELFRFNSHSYRYLINRADDATFKKFIENAPRTIGFSDQPGDDLLDDQSNLLADVLTRLLRDEHPIDRVRGIRSAFPMDANRSAISRSSNIWFSAVKQYAGLKSGTKDQILLGLIERLKKDPRIATALLGILSNKSFLQSDDVRRAVERANLHLLLNDLGRPRSDPDSVDVVNMSSDISAAVKDAIGWVDKLPQLSKAMGDEPINLNSSATWISFDAPLNKVAEFRINPPVDARYTLVSSSNRVLNTQLVRTSARILTSSNFVAQSQDPGRQYVRIEMTAPAPNSKVTLNYLRSYRAGDLPQAKKGGIADIRINSPVSIESKGTNDEAWFRIAAKANTPYILQTRGLQADVDTIIEVYDQTESKKLQDDDDGGEGLASRLALWAPSDIYYDIRLRNVGSAGSFVFEVIEDTQPPN